MHLRNRSARRGVAAIELGFVTVLFVVPLIYGIWEVGRLVHVKQIVANAAREGARLAAQGFTIESNGTQVQIKAAGSTPSVTSVVTDYLQAAGLTKLAASDVTVTFTFTSSRTTAYNPISGVDPSGTSFPVGSIPTDPCYGEKGETFTVYVSIPWTKVRWTTFGLLNPTSVNFTVSWRMLVDDQFQVNTNIPTW
jgi:TadE-like protein